MKKTFLLSLICLLGSAGILVAQTTAPVSSQTVHAQTKADNYEIYHNS